jgi:hypothetical protein
VLLVVCVLAVGVVALVAQPAAAQSTKQQSSDFAPCWKKVLQDWFVDGRIDGVYPRICIAAAEGHLGEDAKQYSSFVQDARRATLAELAYERKHNGHHPPYTYTDNGPGPGPTAGTGGGSESSGPFVRAFDKVGPGSAESVPLPLIVLGGIAILLLLAAAGSFIARRVQAKRLQPPPDPDLT